MPDVHLGAGFGQSCAVKYSFVVNITLLYHCYVHNKRDTLQYNRSNGAPMFYAIGSIDSMELLFIV